MVVLNEKLRGPKLQNDVTNAEGRFTKKSFIKVGSQEGRSCESSQAFILLFACMLHGNINSTIDLKVT